MKVILAEHSGFCFGVKKAIDTAFDEVSFNEGKTPIYSYGPLIHNPQVVAQLQSKGVTVVEDLEVSYAPGNWIIRSHGISEEVYGLLEEKGAKIIDATCPFVRRIQKLVKEYDQRGYQIAIIGDPSHPEVIGINGWCSNKGVIVQSKEDLEKIDSQQPLCVVVQTTMSLVHYEELVVAIKSQVQDLVLFNTICNATKERQEAARQLAQNADAMVVVGGYASSNTQKLVTICRGENPTGTFHVETAEELDIKKLRQYKVLGVTAGASTPHWIIKEVVARLEAIE